MKNYTHEISRKIISKNLTVEQYSSDEIILAEYGVEAILNNVLKYMLVLIIAVIFKRGIDGFAILIVFAMLRFCFGGIHCKSDIGCLLLMVLLFVGTIFCIEVITWDIENMWILVLGNNVIILEKGIHELVNRKVWIGLLTMNLMFLGGYLYGGTLLLAICISATIECLTVLLERKKK